MRTDKQIFILKIKQVPVGTTMRPLAYFPTGIFQHIFWAGLKYFHCDFWSGFTMIYGEKYSFLPFLVRAWPTHGRTDQRTNGRTHPLIEMRGRI